MKLLAEATNMRTTTTLGHNARANGTVEVFWRFWNRCTRVLTDAQCRRWPTFAHICHARDSSSHEPLGGSSPFEIFHGVPARTAFTSVAPAPALEAELPDLDTSDPASFAEAVAASAAAFTRLASHHADYVRSTTANRLNQQGRPRTCTIGEKVKLRVPPSHEQMLSTGRRSSHLASWRGPCTVSQRLSTTACAMTEDATGRKFERVLTNILPCRASTAKTQAVCLRSSHQRPTCASRNHCRSRRSRHPVLPGRSHRHQRHLHHRTLLWMPTAGHLEGHFPPCLAPSRHG